MQATRGLAILLLLQAAGEGLQRLFALPYPGPVVGLVLMLIALNWAALREPVAAAADVLLGNLSLLFVPVGVGVITHLKLLQSDGLQLFVIIVLSTWVGLVVTSLVLRGLLSRKPQGARHG